MTDALQIFGITNKRREPLRFFHLSAKTCRNSFFITWFLCSALKTYQMVSSQGQQVGSRCQEILQHFCSTLSSQLYSYLQKSPVKSQECFISTHRLSPNYQDYMQAYSKQNSTILEVVIMQRKSFLVQPCEYSWANASGCLC